MAKTIFIIFLTLCISGLLNAQQLAFPTADGFGKYTTGGRGGDVYEVTNLKDDGLPGSLRYAINQSGPRTIVFKISGTIALKSTLTISNGNLTIAGQTAPGDGICLRNFNVRIKASNVIIRYLRIRLGEKWGEDALTAYSPKNSGSSGSLPYKNIIIDHCSVSYGCDETLTIYDVENLTIQWCIISESLNKDGHGFGGIWGGWGASFHHNLFAHHKSRAPRFCGARYQEVPEREINDMRYNVIYNAGKTYGGEGGQYNIINNYYKRCKSDFCNPYADDAMIGYWYVEGNHISGDPATTANNWDDGVKFKSTTYNKRLDQPIPSAYIGPEETALEAFDRVTNEVGATLPKRDSVDMRIINDVTNNTGSVPLTLADIPGNPFPVLNSLPAPADDDRDGMPNEWEEANGLSKNDPSDRNNISEDGYTMLEKYLFSLENTITSIQRPETYQASTKVYPNPFKDLITVELSIKKTSLIDIKIYNSNGTIINIIPTKAYNAGNHKINMHLNYSKTKMLDPGIYICKISIDDRIYIKKLTMLQ